jgi:hypothetical protein
MAFGVATAGVYGSRWKAEASVFNGREPDERRWDFDFAPLDSYAARFWFLPSSQWALQVSGGHLNEAENASIGLPRIDVDRVTASATFHRTTLEQTWWATTIGWGRNAEHGDQPTQAVFGETSVTFRDRDALYGRVEWSQKTLHDLAVFAPGVLYLAKLQVGYTRYTAPRHGWRPGIGGSVSTGIVSPALAPEYGGRANIGASLYVTMRPAIHE